MKTSPLIIALAVAFLAGCATDQSSEIERLRAEVAQLRAAAGPLPASLDNLFPPIAETPVWMEQMHKLATRLNATVGSVLSGDTEKAVKYFDEFKDEYAVASKMVPEWESKFEIAPLAAVDDALASGDPDATMGAIGALGGVCHNCHYQNMTKVQHLYLWPRFSEVRVTDTQRGELSMTDVMRSVEVSLVGVGVSLEESSRERAQVQLQDFKKAFSLLEETCEECHESERTYFVDESVHNLINRLEKTLADPSASPQASGNLLNAIGEESCFKCHLVHVPAAITQKTSPAHAENVVGSH